MTRAALLALALSGAAAATPGAVAATPGAAATIPGAAAAEETRAVALGPTRAQVDSSAQSLDFPFTARADEELTGARVRIELAQPAAGTPAIEGLEVLVNDERVALMSPADAGRPREFPVSRDLLADRNTLTVRLRDAAGRCTARAGAWRSVRSIEVLLQTAPVALPNELALLPLPFFDRGFDTKAIVPIVFARADQLRVGALAASWFAVNAPIPLAFTASVGALPDSRAIVLVGSAAEAAALGLDAPRGPSIRLVDHPKHPDSNVKLLVIGGRTAAELRAAVESLALRKESLAGPEVALGRPAHAPPAQPWAAPRWLQSGRPIPFSEYPEASVLSHDGSTPATLSVRFRVAPDLWIWPSEFVALDLGWSERVPKGSPRPRLDVEINGYFLATLPEASEAGRRIRLRIPREHMRGFNLLSMFVHYPEPDPCAVAADGAPRGEPPRVAIAPDSVLHVEGFDHFARLPDVSLFAFDGYPLTRVADLGETTVVVPDQPSAAELSLVLSVFGQIAQVTGRTATGAAFLAASAAGDDALRDRDLLIVGTAQDNALVSRWTPRLPLTIDALGGHAHRPVTPESLLDLLGGIGPLLELRRASRVLETARDVSAIETLESPVTRGRAAILITGAHLPPFDEFLGYAEGRTSGGDVLVYSEGRRWRFEVGTAFGRGSLGPWARLRWFLASHWMVLVPLALCGVLLLAAQARRFIGQRMRRRLSYAGGTA